MAPRKSDDSFLDKLHPIATTARLLSISVQQVGSLVRDGWIPQKEGGAIDLIEAVQGYYRSKLEAGQAEKRERDSRLSQLRIARDSVALAEKRKQLVEVVPFMNYIMERLATFFTALDGIPAALTRDAKERRRIKEKIDAARNEFTAEQQREAARIRSLIDGGSSSPPVAA